ncbi:MAG: hypothetical protein ACUVS9_03325 [Thermaceae bacterium]
MGPTALRYARLKDGLEALGFSVTDLGDVSVPVAETLPQEEGVRFLEAIHEVFPLG